MAIYKHNFVIRNTSGMHAFNRVSQSVIPATALREHLASLTPTELAAMGMSGFTVELSRAQLLAENGERPLVNLPASRVRKPKIKRT